MANDNARHFLVVATLVLTAISSAASTPAQARIKKPGLDSLSQECFRVQSESDKLVAEYKNASNARREAILTELRKLGSYWIAAGCRHLFGDISKFQRGHVNDYTPSESLVDGVNSGGGSSGGTTQTPAPGPFLY